GNVLAREQWHVEVVAAPTEWMRAVQALRINVAETLPRRCLRCTQDIFSKLVRKDQLVAVLDPRVERQPLLNAGDFVDAVRDLRRERDRAVARDRPRGCRPDNDARILHE